MHALTRPVACARDGGGNALAPAPGRAAWDDAVDCFVREWRFRESALRLLREAGVAGSPALPFGSLEATRAALDVVLDGLVAALARRPGAPAWPDIARALWRAFETRQAFCRSVRMVLQNLTEEQQVLLDEAGKGSIVPLLTATQTLWRCRTEADDATRGAVGARLHAMTDAVFEPA